MKAIRIEHNDGYGMFRASINGTIRKHSILVLNTQKASQISGSHHFFNTPQEDGIDIQTNEYCAYYSIGQMQKYITNPQLQYLFELGYRVYEIELSKCKQGEYQIVYNKDNITNKIDISNKF